MSSLVALPGGDRWVGFPFTHMGGMASFTTAGTVFTAATFDAANDSAAIVFPAPRTGDIYDVEFPMTNTAFSGTIKVGFVALAGALFPGTTPTFSHSATFTPASGWVTPSGYIGAGGAGSGAKLSVTKGELICLCWSASAYTSGSCTLKAWNQNSTLLTFSGTPYTGLSNAGAAWATGFDFPCFSLYYDDGAGNKEATATPVGPYAQPFNGTINSNAISSSNPKMAGLKFKFPQQVSIDAILCIIDSDATITPRLVKTGTTADLLTNVFSPNATQRRANGPFGLMLTFPDVTLDANTFYRFLFQQSASATACAFVSYATNDTGDMAAMGGGADFYATKSNTAFASLTGTDATDYTDTTTDCPLIAVRVSKVHDGVGGGGGGMRLAGHGGLAA